MYRTQMLGALAAGSHPLSQLPRMFPWISPGEVLDDGAVSFSVLKRWDGGVRLALYDRGGIMVDSQDFFRTPTMGELPAERAEGLSYGGIFGTSKGIFTGMSSRGLGGVGFPGQPNWGLFSPAEGTLGPMSVAPRGQAPGGYHFSGLGGPLDPTSLAVNIVQRALVVAGTRPAPGSVDGLWGPNTEASLREWVTTNAGPLGADPARVLATFSSVPARAQHLSLPNVLASRLEALSGRYSGGGTSTSAPAPSGGGTSTSAPSGGGKGAATTPTSADTFWTPGVPDLPMVTGALSRRVLGAPVWVWGVAGTLVALSAAYFGWASIKKRKRARARVAANRRRRRGTRRAKGYGRRRPRRRRF